MACIYEAEFPNISMFHSFDKHPDQSYFHMHIHNTNEVFLFVSGKATYLVEGTEYPLRPGSLLLMRSAESHAINILSDEPYERYGINFSDSLFSAIDPEARLLAPFYNRPLGVGNLYVPEEIPGEFTIHRFKTMCQEKADKYEEKMSLISNFLPLLNDILYAQKNRTEEFQVSQGLASDIIIYINEHLFEDLSVPMIANHFYISASQAERTFKKATHSSVWHYIVAKRLAAARAKIEAGESTYAVCNECGFGDYSAFYRAYVKEYGLPPTSYKKERG